MISNKLWSQITKRRENNVILPQDNLPSQRRHEIAQRVAMVLNEAFADTTDGRELVTMGEGHAVEAGLVINPSGHKADFTLTPANYEEGRVTMRIGAKEGQPVDVAGLPKVFENMGMAPDSYTLQQGAEGPVVSVDSKALLSTLGMEHVNLAAEVMSRSTPLAAGNQDLSAGIRNRVPETFNLSA